MATTSSLRSLVIALFAALLALSWILLAPYADGSDGSGIAIGPQLPFELLMDPGGRLDAETVSQLDASSFTPQHRPLSLGYTSAVSWVRFVPPPQRGNAPWWMVVSPPFLDRLDVFVNVQGRLVHSQLGDQLPASARPIRDRHFVLPIEPTPGSAVLLRLETSSASLLQIHLTTPEAYVSARLPSTFLWGSYFGLATVSTILCIGLALVRRSRLLRALSAFSVAYVMTASTQGFAQVLLLPDTPQLAHHLTSISVLLTIAAHLWLIREAHAMRQHLPRLDRLVFLASVAITATAPLAVLDIYPMLVRIVFVIAGAAHLLGLYAAIRICTTATFPVIQRGISAAMSAASLVGVAATVAISGVLEFPTLLQNLWQYCMLGLMLAITVASLHDLWEQRRTVLALQARRIEQMARMQVELERLVNERTADLQQSKAHLEQALRDERHAHLRQRRFIAMVSHEFRTPLSIIGAAATNLAEFPHFPPADHARRLQQILAAVRRLNTLTDNCLADARLQESTPALHFAPADLAEVATAAADLVRISERHGVELEVTPGTNTRCICDAALIHISISNILDNAVKYGYQGVITIYLHSDEVALVLTIRDTGPGIPPHDHERIFAPWERGHSTTGRAGSGMGLFVSREILRAHGGELRLAASEGPGATFELRLPRTPRQPEAQP